MTKLYADFIEGTTTTNPLLIGGTTLASAVFEFLPVVASPDTLRLVLDPERVVGEPEVVIVTAHTAAATSVTVTRAADGTTAREHLTGTKVVLSLVTSDLEDLQGSGNATLVLSTSAIDISETTDVSVISHALTVAVGDMVEVEIIGRLKQNSGAQRTFQITGDFNDTWDNEMNFTMDTGGLGGWYPFKGKFILAVPSSALGIFHGEFEWDAIG
ncbi:MAG: hypothetical protein WEF28_09330, partial [Acidimicrobiia bacterium]